MCEPAIFTLSPVPSPSLSPSPAVSWPSMEWHIHDVTCDMVCVVSTMVLKSIHHCKHEDVRYWPLFASGRVWTTSSENQQYRRLKGGLLQIVLPRREIANYLVRRVLKRNIHRGVTRTVHKNRWTAFYFMGCCT